MNSCGVVVDHLPSDVAVAEEYLARLRDVFAGADRIILPIHADDTLDGLRGIHLIEWAERQRAHVIEAPVAGWAKLNYAVALSDCENVVVLEEDWWPVTGMGQKVLAVLGSKEDNAVLYLNRRDCALDDARLAIPCRYARSTPRDVRNPGFAYAMKRDMFLRLRGYDESKHLEDVAGIDFRVRVQRAALQVHQLDGPDAAVYHVESIGGPGDNDGVKGVNTRRVMQAKVDQDLSIYRNLVQWSVPIEYRVPLITVAVATKDRAALLPDSIYSILYQTFQDFEIIIVDDGSESDDAKRFIQSLDDPRIRYYKQESSGIAKARNVAADKSNCHFTAVHDDDDIMVPHRLELSLASLTADYDASYGSWVNFSDSTAEMRVFLGKMGFGEDLNAFNGQAPGHATWLVPTELIRSVRYDERINASVDHELATRLSWVGVKWVHTGQVMYLRRVHDHQVTSMDGPGQKRAHVFARFGNTLMASPSQRDAMAARGKALPYPNSASSADLIETFGAYLPDRLVQRELTFTNNLQTNLFATDMPDRMRYVLEDRDLVTQHAYFEAAVVEPVLLADLARLQKIGILSNASITATLRPSLSDRPDSFQAYEASDFTTEDGLLLDEPREGGGESALNERLRSISQGFRSKYPQGLLIQLPNAEPDTELADQSMCLGAVLARRVLVASEFGRKMATRVYGFSDPGLALIRVGEHIEHVPNAVVLIPDVLSPDDLWSAFTARREAREPIEPGGK